METRTVTSDNAGEVHAAGAAPAGNAGRDGQEHTGRAQRAPLK